MRIPPLGYPEAQIEQMNNLVLSQPDYNASDTLPHCFCHRGFCNGKLYFSELNFLVELYFSPENFFPVKKPTSWGYSKEPTVGS